MRIHHIAMRTKQLARLEPFYADLLGLPVVHRDGTRSVWLRAGDSILMLEEADEGEPTVPLRTMELVAFAVHLDELERYKRLLGAHGVAIEAETAYTVYFRDPDGRRIGLSHFPGVA